MKHQDFLFYTDVNLNIDILMVIMRETRPDDFINYLCDEFGFERPSRKTPDKIRQDIEAEVSEINKRLAILIRHLPPEQEAAK
jgi:Icc-related predicted phosphoesterase